MSRKTLLVLNRKSAARPDVREIVKSLTKKHNLEVVVPWSRKQLKKFVQKAADKGTTRVIAGGGDGTLNKVGNAVLSLGEASGVSLGLVPLGTANDFARSYGDLGQDLGRSIRIAATGTAVPIDVGSVNGIHFINVASGGFGAMITATTPQEVKRRLGGLAYTLAGMARLSELTPVRSSFCLDDGDEVTADVSALVIANNRFAGGGFDVAPEADLRDGLLDLGVLSRESLMGGKINFSGPREKIGPINAFIRRATFREAVIKTEAPFHINLDGEPIVDTQFEVSILPGRLPFVWPSAGAT